MKYILPFKKFNENMIVDPAGNLEYPDCIAAYDEDDENSAYEKGIEASDKGYDLEDCPFYEEELKHAWIEGFNSDKTWTVI